MSRRPPDRGRVNNRTDVDFEIRIPNVSQEPPVDDDDDEFITPARARAIRVEIDAMIAAGDWPPKRCDKRRNIITPKVTPAETPPDPAGCPTCGIDDDATCYIPARLCARKSAAVG